MKDKYNRINILFSSNNYLIAFCKLGCLEVKVGRELRDPQAKPSGSIDAQGVEEPPVRYNLSKFLHQVMNTITATEPNVVEDC